MRCYVIDELDEGTIRHIADQLGSLGFASGIANLYWLPLEDSMLLPIHQEHAESCGPHVMALEVLDTSLRLELLVRAKNKLRCECVCYTSREAEQAMMNQLDDLVEEVQKEELNMLMSTCC